MKEISLDTQISAKPSSQVYSKIKSFRETYWRDLSYSYNFEKNLSETLQAAYQLIYKLVDADPKDHFILTSSGAESVNHAIFSTYLNVTRKTGKNHFIAGSIDEKPALNGMGRLKEMGCIFHKVPADSLGKITLQAVIETLTPRTAMLSLSWANAFTGVVQPVAEIGALCKERGILFHVDATHVLGRGPYSFPASHADLFSFDGRSLHGPQACGGLFAKKELDISPLIMGDVPKMRGGELDGGALIGLAEAAKETLQLNDHLCTEISRLRDLFEQKILKGYSAASLLFSEEERVPHLSTIVFPGIKNDALFCLLMLEGVYACKGGNNLQPLECVLKECRVNAALSQCGLSFGFSRETTEQDVEVAAKRIVAAAKYLQTFSDQLWM